MRDERICPPREAQVPYPPGYTAYLPAKIAGLHTNLEIGNHYDVVRDYAERGLKLAQ